MANKIEYIFSLRDQISSKLGSITAVSDRTKTALSGIQEKVKTAGDVFTDTGKSVGSLKLKIDALQAEKEWIPSDNIPAIKEYNREISRLTKEIERLETAGSGGKFKKWASDAFSAIPGADLLKNPLVAGMSAIGFSGKQAMNFDENMAQVNITAQLDEAGLDDLKKRIKAIAQDNKTDIVLAPKGFEQINSQLNDVDLSLEILDASLKGSKAGFTDVNTVSAALAQTLSIVGKENTTAMEVLDTFFASKRVGAGEFEDFAMYMPNLIAGASNLGIAYKEVAGTFAYMTGKGQSAERAAVLMENAFSILGRGEVREKMAKAGVNIFDDQGKIRSVVDIFSDLQGILSSLNDEQKSSLLEKFGLVDKEAKNAFAILTSDIDKLRNTMDEVSASAGETDKNLEFSANSMQKVTEVWNQFKNIGLTVGEMILPLISGGLEVISIVLSGVSAVLGVVTGFFSSWYTLLQEGNPLVVGLTTAIGVYTAAMAVNYAITNKAVIIGGIKKAIDIAQTAATWALTAAQTALNVAFKASPLGWVAMAIGAVVTAVTYCWQKFVGFRVAVLGTWQVIKEFGRTLLDSIVKPFKQVLSGIGGVCSAIVNLLKGNFKEAASAAKEGFRDIGEGVLGANPASVIYNSVRNGNYSEAWEKGKHVASDSWANSQKVDDSQAANQLIPDIPDVPTPATPQMQPSVDFEALMNKVGAKSKTKAKGSTLKLDTVKADLNETAEYAAAAGKLTPVAVSFKPQVQASDIQSQTAAAGNVISAVLPATGKVDDSTQEYDSEEKGCLFDIMQNVRKIAASIVVPMSLSAATVTAQDIPVPQISDAYNVETVQESHNTVMSENTRTYNDNGRNVYVSKVCDEVVIHVQNTDQKGSETIRAEIMRILDELAEG